MLLNLYSGFLSIVSLVLNGEGAGRPYTLAGQDQAEIMPMIFPLSQLVLPPSGSKRSAAEHAVYPATSV